MVLNAIARNAPLFLLIFVRIFALLRIAPITSSESIPSIARTAMVFFTSFAVFPAVLASGYPLPDTGMGFILLAVGEMLIGIITAFFLQMIFATVQLAGQFFSLQMGFGASQVFDPLAQIEIPLVGQLFNMVAMMIFVVSGGLQRIFLHGLMGSFEVMRATDLAGAGPDLVPMITGSLARLFEQSLILAFPILGILFTLQITMGLFGKAAPQMNLLMLGFPLAIGVAFVVMIMTMPFLVEGFEVVIDAAFSQVDLLFAEGPR